MTLWITQEVVREEIRGHAGLMGKMQQGVELAMRQRFHLELADASQNRVPLFWRVERIEQILDREQLNHRAPPNRPVRLQDRLPSPP